MWLSNMQKSRPLGVTILAYWALAGSGALFVLHAFFLAGGSFTDDVFANILGPLGAIAAPLGSGSINFLTIPLGTAYSYVALVLAVFFAIVGLHTLQGRRWAWFANVGMSVAAFVQLAVGLSFYLLAGLVRGNEGMIFIAPNIAFIAVSVLRLYYLFRPNVRDFFDTWSIFAQKRTA